VSADLDRARIEVERLLSSYPLLLDSGDVEGCVALFTDDGEFTVYGNTVAGREALQQYFEAARERGRVGIHLPGPTLVDVAPDGATATTWQSFIFVANGENTLTRGMYRDLAEYDGERWRFRRREVDIYPGAG
jgi:uncharacterized protein (TIGR02246 family)